MVFIIDMMLLTALQAEIERLRSLVGEAHVEQSVAGLSEVTALREQLKNSEFLMKEMTRTWQEKLQQAEKKKAEESQRLAVCGGSVIITSGCLSQLTL